MGDVLLVDSSRGGTLNLGTERALRTERICLEQRTWRQQAAEEMDQSTTQWVFLVPGFESRVRHMNFWNDDHEVQLPGKVRHHISSFLHAQEPRLERLQSECDVSRERVTRLEIRVQGK